MLLVPKPAVITACLVPVDPPLLTMHVIAVSELHSLPSHAVDPNLPLLLIPTMPSPCPCTVTLALPVAALFTSATVDAELTSYDTCWDMMFRAAAMVTEACTVLPAPAVESLHANAVYESHSLASQAVTPMLVLWVQPNMKPSPSKVTSAFDPTG